MDLVTIGGDLWEEEHVTADTCNWVAAKLAEVRVPVALICGNHDPLVPGGDHARTVWPANVHLFPSPDLTEFPLDEVSVWGHRGAAVSSRRRFSIASTCRGTTGPMCFCCTALPVRERLLDTSSR